LDGVVDEVEDDSGGGDDGDDELELDLDG